MFFSQVPWNTTENFWIQDNYISRGLSLSYWKVRDVISKNMDISKVHLTSLLSPAIVLKKINVFVDVILELMGSGTIDMFLSADKTNCYISPSKRYWQWLLCGARQWNLFPNTSCADSWALLTQWWKSPLTLINAFSFTIFLSEEIECQARYTNCIDPYQKR